MPTSSPIDTILARLANASQLGLLILAVFGYFYTVLPVYQKALLDEDIAKKTLALNSLEAKLAARDAELMEKNTALLTLNATLEKAQQRLNQSQAVIGNLRGAVQTQYSELLPRLLQEFQELARIVCKLDAVPDGGFSDCVNQKILPRANLSALTNADRALLGGLVKQANTSIQESWRESIRKIEQQKAAAQQRKNDATATCEQKRASDDYKNSSKAILIDYQCKIDALNAQTALLHIGIDELQSSGEILSPALSTIVKRFLETVGTQRPLTQ
jgi:DNA repair exonuclease SbcCD ATPase subunit